MYLESLTTTTVSSDTGSLRLSRPGDRSQDAFINDVNDYANFCIQSQTLNFLKVPVRLLRYEEAFSVIVSTPVACRGFLEIVSADKACETALHHINLLLEAGFQIADSSVA